MGGAWLAVVSQGIPAVAHGANDVAFDHVPRDAEAACDLTLVDAVKAVQNEDFPAPWRELVDPSHDVAQLLFVEAGPFGTAVIRDGGLVHRQQTQRRLFTPRPCAQRPCDVQGGLIEVATGVFDVGAIRFGEPSQIGFLDGISCRSLTAGLPLHQGAQAVPVSGQVGVGGVGAHVVAAGSKQTIIIIDCSKASQSRVDARQRARSVPASWRA
jgi:hypothetical protein